MNLSAQPVDGVKVTGARVSAVGVRKVTVHVPAVVLNNPFHPSQVKTLTVLESALSGIFLCFEGKGCLQRQLFHQLLALFLLFRCSFSKFFIFILKKMESSQLLMEGLVEEYVREERITLRLTLALLV